MSTQAEVARHLGISQRSVSVAFGGAGRISPQTCQAVLKAAKQLGYRPNRLASSLRTGRTGSVGVVWAFINPWTGDSEIGMEVLRRLQNRGIATYQAHHGDDRDIPGLCERLEELISRRVDAIVMQGIPSELMDPRVLNLLRGVPTVAICREDLPDFPGDLVIHDRTAAIREVVDHFVRSGRRRLAMAMSIEQESNPSKFAAFQARCREHGLPPHAHELIRLDYPDSPRSHGSRHDTAMQRQFPGAVEVDAIFSFNDIGAMYITRGLKRRGLRVPEDVAVVGFNDTEPAAVWDPPLASGDRKFADAANQLDQLVAQRLAEPDAPPRRATVHMSFVWRESAGGVAPAATVSSEQEQASSAGQTV